MYSFAADGANAVEVVPNGIAGAGIFVCGSTLTGGRGGDSHEDLFTDNVWPGNGGDGLAVDAGAVAQIRDATLVGGSPGVGLGCPPLVPPQSGAPTSGTGAFYTLSAPRIMLSAPAIVREGSTMHISVRGTPGEIAYLSSGRAPTFQPVPSFGGIVLVSTPPPSRVLILGEIPIGGTLDADLAIPSQGVGFSAHQQYIQAFTRDGSGGTTLGSFAVVSVVDSTY
jgi:hypothetical protein